MLALRSKAFQSTNHQGFRYTEASPRVLERERRAGGGGQGALNKGDVDVERNIRITLHQMPRLPVFTPQEYVAVFQNGPVKPSERTTP